jgi:hypothetical protein
MVTISTEIANILHDLKSTDAKTVDSAMTRYRQLVDRFYQKHEDMMSAQQHKAAVRDIEYFMRLVELAEEYRTSCRVS